tara:strand:+ start:201 stop:626 length:426 start_codon:yes stop_codon:yes gene_type:complete
MKDKQTYITRKEHSTDVSYENEATITNEDRGDLDLTLLIEQHKKDIWEWKQKESQWARDKNQLEGHKRIVEELSTKVVELTKKVRAAEGETSIIKGIGMNSPEMRAAQDDIKELRKNLTEVKQDNKNLAEQIEHLNKQRKF